MKTKRNTGLFRKARAAVSVVLAWAMIASLPGVLSPSAAQAASQSLENTVLRVVLDDSDRLEVRQVYLKPDLTTNHMSVARLGLKYDDADFKWFSQLPGSGGTLQTPDGKLQLTLSATLVDPNPFFTTTVTVSTVGTNSVSNLTLFQGSDEDIHGTRDNDIGLYIPEVDAVVAYDSANMNLYLGFAGSLRSAAHDVGGATSMWTNVAADNLNNSDSSFATDVGIAQSWSLGNVASGGTATLKVTWAVGTSLQEFTGNIVAADTTPPTIRDSTLTSPNGGESWAGGSTHNITWVPADITDPTLKANPITLYYQDGAGDWVQIATDEANDGSYTWTVPSLDVPNSKVRVTATDLATNSSSDDSGAVFAIDSTAPTVGLTYKVNEVERNVVRDADTLVITATFTEAMAASPTIAIDAPGTGGDIAATNMTATADPAIWTYNYVVPAASDGTATVTISGTDLAGHASQAATNNTFTIDNTAPTLSIGGPSASLTTSGPVTYTVTYTGADSVTLANADITLNRTGTASGTVSVSGDGAASRTVTVSSITGDGTLGITIAAGTASDAAGNSASGAGPSTTFTTDNTAPTLPAGNIVGTTVQDGGDTIELTFSEPVVAPNGWATAFSTIKSPPGGSALVLTHAGFIYSESNKTLTITLDEATDGAYLVNGNTIAVTPAAGAIKDAAGNSLAITEVVGTTLNSSDDAPPTVELTYKVNDVARNVVRDADTLTITATFNEAMVGNTPTIAIDTTFIDLPATNMAMVGGDNKVWSYSYDVPPASDGLATVTISGTDLAGNLNLPATNNTFTIDNTAPTLPAANIVGTTVQDGGDKIVLTFSEPVVPADGAWSANEFSSIESPNGPLDANVSYTIASKGNGTATWSTAQSHTGGNSVRLQSGVSVGQGDEGRIVITMPAGTTLKDIVSISWWEYNAMGYPPHADVLVDTNGDGTADDALVFEYAYNNMAHYAVGAMPYGAVQNAWKQTFNDDGDGPSAITDTSFAWLTSGPPGPPGDASFNEGSGTLASWKTGKTVSGKTINQNTPVLRIEIEVDNWVVQSEAYVDSVSINGATYDPEPVLANATFSYAGNTLTITLDEATDGAYLVNGRTIAVTPATGKITDAAGNPLAATEVPGTTTVNGDRVAPTVVELTYNPDRPVKGGENLLITAEFSEAMTASPTIAIDAPGAAGDVLPAVAMTVTVGTENKVWTYTYNVPAVVNGDATVTISGTDLAGNDVQAAGAFTIDNGPAPTLLAANIVGTTRQGLGDTIVLTFSEFVQPADNTWSADEFASIKSPPGGNALILTNAGFLYSGNTLTITLNEAQDGAYLVNGGTIDVTPAQNKITDVAANPLADGKVEGTVAITGDTVAPTVSLAYVPSHAVKGGDALLITATFSEDVVWATPTIAIATQGDGDLAATPMAMVEGNRAVWSYRWTVASGSDEDGTATVTISGRDLAGNSNEAATYNTFIIDNTPPALPQANIVGTTRQGQGDTIALTFSEPVVPADGEWGPNELTSIESPNGTALTFANAGFAYAGNTLTITLSEAADNSYRAYLVNGQTIAVTPAQGKITDVAGNPLAPDKVVGTTLNTGDSTRPTATLAYNPNRTVRDDDTLTITATFSEAMVTEPTVFIDTQGIDLAGAMVMGANNTTWTYTYDVPPGSDGAAMVMVYGSDLAGNSVEVTFNNTFRINNTSPTLSVASIVGTTRQGQGDTIVLTFSEPVVAISNDWKAAFTALARSDGTPLPLDHATLDYSGVTLTITLDEAQDGAYLVNGQAIAVTPAAGRITDIAGNSLDSGQVVSAAAASGDSTRPTVSLDYDLGRPVRDADILTITATFSEAMTPAPKIAIDTPGSDLSDTSLTVVAGTGNKVWTHSYEVPAGSDGTAFITISGTDLAGNAVEAAVNSLFTIDNTAPTVSLSSTATEPTSVWPIPVTVTFSEVVTGFDLSDIAITNGVAGSLAGLNNTVFTFMVTPAGQGPVTVSIAASVAQDLAGNSSTAATPLSRTYRFGPTLVLTSPNGAEDWPIGSRQTITWSSFGLRGLVRIELSADGGATWQTVVSRTRDDGTHAWTVQGPETTQARVRVSSLSNRDVSDASNASFSIPVPEIEVTSPGFNTIWEIGDRVAITWTSPVLSGLVRIELSRDGGATWQTIVSRTRNDGSHVWTVRGPATTQALIRVTSLSTGGSDTNDISFRIED
ncbi:MAG: hypothetical protein HYY01_00775 [Chloroflexi bacterium]|nr:hypothetical protein [Chloroflexota bacterium]